MKTIKINSPFITLGQLLKYADIIQSGGHAKLFLEENIILYNGGLESRRGKKIFPGDTVTINGDIVLRIETKS